MKNNLRLLVIAAIVIVGVSACSAYAAVQANSSQTEVAGPKGATGDSGPAGSAGAPGATGLDGLPGATGPAGPRGLAGANGQAGTTGQSGSQGVAGASGSTSIATFASDIDVGNILNSIAPSYDVFTTIPVDASNKTYGKFQYNVGTPFLNYDFGELLKYNSFTVSNIDTRQHDYTISIRIVVSDNGLDPNGLQSVVITGSATADNGVANDTATIQLADMTDSTNGGAVAYIPGTGQVSSSGVPLTFYTSITYTGSWN